MNGRFHGLLTDRTRGTTRLFNDRYGMHLIHYHEAKEAFYFAAEAKAILAVRPELRRADLRGLGEFFACGCVLEIQTLFKGIPVLQPAVSWVFRNGAIEGKGAYFQPREWEDQTPLKPEAYYQELREIFSRNLPRYFNGRERIGMSLTGGLDTRMIMAWQKSPPESLLCYTFGSMFGDCQDVLVARQVAHACRQPYKVIPVGEEFLSRFPYYAERTVYLTDGCTDVSHSADLYANERAAEVAPIRMTGNYGSEVLRRVRAFKPVKPASGLFCQEFLSHVHMAHETYAGLLRGHPVSFAVFQQAPWYHYGLLALEQTQLSLRSPYLDNDFVRTVFRSPDSGLANADVCLRLIADAHASQIQRIKGYEIVGVCAREGLMARQLYERFPVKRYFTDLPELLNEAQPDVGHITTPPESHFAIARSCLERGCHVYVEKPFTLHEKEAQILVALAYEKGLKLTAGHDDQFSHVARRMRTLVQSGYLGEGPVHMESYYCYDLGEPGNAQGLLGDKHHWVCRLPGKLLQNVISHGIARVAEFLTIDSPQVIAYGFVSPLLKRMDESESSTN